MNCHVLRKNKRKKVKFKHWKTLSPELKFRVLTELSYLYLGKFTQLVNLSCKFNNYVYSFQKKSVCDPDEL